MMNESHIKSKLSIKILSNVGKYYHVNYRNRSIEDYKPFIIVKKFDRDVSYSIIRDTVPLKLHQSTIIPTKMIKF